MVLSMAAQADEHNWLCTYSFLAPSPAFSPLLCEAEAGTAKRVSPTPLSADFPEGSATQGTRLEREWKVRERRDFVSSFSQHHTSFSPSFSVHSPHQPPRASLDVLPSEPHPPGHQNANRCTASPTGCTSPQAQPTLPDPLPRAPRFSLFYLLAAAFCS